MLFLAVMGVQSPLEPAAHVSYWPAARLHWNDGVRELQTMRIKTSSSDR